MRYLLHEFILFRGYGVAKGVPTLVISACAADDVVAISGFGIFLGKNNQSFIQKRGTSQASVFNILHFKINH